MNILFFNLNRGAGVETIGNTFLEILSKIEGIDNIDVWTTQDLSFIQRFKFDKKYDVIICNDISNCYTICNEYKKIFKNIKHDNTVVFDISHGTTDYKNELFDAIIELNGHDILNKNIFSLPFIQSNIWQINKTNISDFSNDYVILCRIEPAKIDLNILKLFKEKNKANISIYGKICTDDTEWLDNLKNVANVFDFLDNQNDIIFALKKYKNLLVISNSECLCLPIREALHIGCKVFVYDLNKKYTKNIFPYINYINNDGSIIINENCLHFLPYFQSEYSFENNILKFFMILKIMTCNNDLKLSPLYTNNNIKYLCNNEDNKQNCFVYGNEIMWNNLNF